MARSILTTLKQEHEQLRELFKQIAATTDRAEKGRSELLQRIEKLLIPHAKWEEAEFYPALAERADRAGLQAHAEALMEHRVVEDAAIPLVEEADTTTPEFAGRAKVLGELVDHHAKEEEKTVFALMRELFSAEELAQMDQDYADWKDSGSADTALLGAQVKAGAKATVGKMLGH